MRLSFTLLSLGLLSVTPSALAAGQDDATERARASFYQGVELYKEGSYEAALAEFQKAYDTSPSYRILYNIAQSYFQLRDYASSYRTLKDYVERAGDELTAERRAQVDELNRKLEKRIAYLEIVCNLDDADIRVDDISVGKSPLAAAVLVNAGPRRISAVRPGYAVATRAVTVAGGEQATVLVELATATEPRTSKAPPPGPALLVSRPPAAVEATQPQPKRSRTGLIISLSAASGCAIMTGVFGWQMLRAKSDFDREVGKRPYDRTAVYDARSRALTYQYLTDGFAAATLVASGVALYLVLRDDSGATQPNHAKARSSVALVPVGAGVALQGAW
jgi:hypothetical protein